MKFDEQAFLYAMTIRPEDARRFATTFKPDWLHTTEYTPILAEIFAFTRKHGEPPSVDTLHSVFKDKDEEAYNLRYKTALDSITSNIPDTSSILYTLDNARETGVVRDFQELQVDQAFLKKQEEYKGTDMLKSLHSYFNRHGELSKDKTMDIREAVDHLIDNHGFQPELVRIPCGIEVIDKWTDGGLRTKQLGIIMAPTGDGKSTVLCIMAHKMATGAPQARTWMVTNELSIEEQTERMLARLTGVPVKEIIDNPGTAYKGLDRHWRAGVHDRLRITECNREVSVDDLEAEMMQWVTLIGWKPQVLVLDFIERMKPCGTGYSRDRGWEWLGAIACDLSRFAKRHNILVWTAAQTNRSAYARDNAPAMGLDMAQGSVKHLQEASSIIGMRQVHVAEDQVAMEMVDLKQRFSRRTNKPVFLECDLGRMSITNNEWEPDEPLPKDTSSKSSSKKKKDKPLTPGERQKLKRDGKL